MFWPRTTPVLYRFDMWNIPRVSLLAVATALLLSGCAPGDSRATRDPTPSSTPIFATEEEALAAATAAYAAYQAALDRGFATHDTSRLVDVAGDSALTAAKASVERYRTENKRQVGESKIDSVSLVNSSGMRESGRGDDHFQIYACLDVAGTDVLNDQGRSVVQADRALRFPLIVSLKWNTSSGSLFVVEEGSWDGANFC